MITTFLLATVLFWSLHVLEFRERNKNSCFDLSHSYHRYVKGQYDVIACNFVEVIKRIKNTVKINKLFVYFAFHYGFDFFKF